MITNLGQYKRELAKFIREEEKGVKDYEELSKELPPTEGFDSIRHDVRRIMFDERKHIAILRKLYKSVS